MVSLVGPADDADPCESGDDTVLAGLANAFPDAGSDGRADIFATGSDDKLYAHSNLSSRGVAVGNSGWLDFQALS
ncbi:hypothetical protein RI138_18665 [Streptomyces sp. C11-1]|uniref:Uncharacterized protein n=1 Tax=Streptomyces durocortorensis TaxID=2811104 RepID=A0ABY9W6Q3_9ACTN|nr:hypothetical protein [Streptomyces durocortorensis]WNF31500.1 hypothetical protein RI138_18665 [Streptomyces durocortorensis]